MGHDSHFGELPSPAAMRNEKFSKPYCRLTSDVNLVINHGSSQKTSFYVHTAHESSSVTARGQNVLSKDQTGTPCYACRSH